MKTNDARGARVWVGGSAELSDDLFAVAWVDRQDEELLGAGVVEEGIGIGALAALYREIAEEHGAPATLWVPTREQEMMLRKELGPGVEITSGFDERAAELFEAAMGALEQELEDEQDGDPMELNEGDPVLDLKITLRGITPPIWRRLRLDAAMPLDALHAVLNVAMGWDDDHLHEFEIKGTRYDGTGDAEDDPDDGRPWEGDFVLADLVSVGDQLTYKYDFGDGWVHDIVIEGEAKASEGDPVAICVEGARACPPEDCGGLPGYEALDEDGFDPEAFSTDDVNADLEEMFFGADGEEDDDDLER